MSPLSTQFICKLLVMTICFAVAANSEEMLLQTESITEESTSSMPLMLQFTQNTGLHENCSHHSEDESTNSTIPSPDPDPSRPALVCTARCPLCPKCPPTLACPSPCPAVPQCPEPQVCPSPCAKCPACPTCKRPIPPGYEHFPGLGYYRLHTVPRHWMAAKDTCEREGAHLVIINSQEEANLMKRFFTRDADIGSWILIGFHDMYKEGKYVTVLGQPLSKAGFYSWDKYQPDNYRNEDCGSLTRSGLLNDQTCENPFPFVCEFPF